MFDDYDFKPCPKCKGNIEMMAWGEGGSIVVCQKCFNAFSLNSRDFFDAVELFNSGRYKDIGEYDDGGDIDFYPKIHEAIQRMKEIDHAN